MCPVNVDGIRGWVGVLAALEMGQVGRGMERGCCCAVDVVVFVIVVVGWPSTCTPAIRFLESELRFVLCSFE